MSVAETKARLREHAALNERRKEQHARHSTNPDGASLCTLCYVMEDRERAVLAAATLQEALAQALRHLSADHACSSQRRGPHSRVWSAAKKAGLS